MSVAAANFGGLYYARVASKHMTSLWIIMSERCGRALRPSDPRSGTMKTISILSAEEDQNRVLILNNPSQPRGQPTRCSARFNSSRRVRLLPRTLTTNQPCAASH
jgi:hypothetical protein